MPSDDPLALDVVARRWRLSRWPPGCKGIRGPPKPCSVSSHRRLTPGARQRSRSGRVSYRSIGLNAGRRSAIGAGSQAPDLAMISPVGAVRSRRRPISSRIGADLVSREAFKRTRRPAWRSGREGRRARHGHGNSHGPAGSVRISFEARPAHTAFAAFSGLSLPSAARLPATLRRPCRPGRDWRSRRPGRPERRGRGEERVRVSA